MNDLSTRIVPLVGRIAAVGLLAAVLWAIGALLAAPAYERYRALGEDILSAREQLGRVEAVLGSSLAPPSAQDSSAQSWRGQSRSIVAAKVQAFLQDHARRHGVAVISISPLDARPFEGFETIGLRIECEGEIGAVRDLIGALENAEPFLFITGTDLRRQQIFGVRRPDQKLPLAARLDVFAPFVEDAGT